MQDPTDPAVAAAERQELRNAQIALTNALTLSLQSQADDRTQRQTLAAQQGVKYVPPPKPPPIPSDLRCNTGGLDPIETADAWRKHEQKVN